MNKKQNKRKSFLATGVLAVSLFFSGCADKVQFTQQSSTQFFTQDFIPEFVDIMWMINDRSPMVAVRENLRNEASKFFQRLDNVAHQYQMGFVTADMLNARGKLAPKTAPVVLTKDFGTIEQRTSIFANNVINNLFINLSTSGLDQGFESIHLGLTINESATPSFKLRENVPLVLVMISDSDDHSSAPSGVDAVGHWATKLLELKGNNPDLIRAYAINYTDTGERCSNSKGISADIGKPGFEDRYFRLATLLNGQTADLCGSFADDIDLSGLQLEQLKTRFLLASSPNVNTLQVSVLIDGSSVATPPWHYEAATNEIVFDSPPPMGSTISVTFLPGSAE